jgi:hypothetical protein
MEWRMTRTILIIGALAFTQTLGASANAPAQLGQSQQPSSDAAHGDPNSSDYVINLSSYSGACAIGTLGRGDEGRRIIDTCHGWSMASCGSTLAAVSHGVTEDQVRIVSSLEGGDATMRRSILDGNRTVLEQIRRSRGSNYELLDMTYRAPVCDDGRITIPFEGSTILANAYGASRPMNGELIAEANGTIRVQFSHI